MSIKFIGIFLTVKGHHEYNPARNMVISIFHDKASKHSFINKFQILNFQAVPNTFSE